VDFHFDGFFVLLKILIGREIKKGQPSQINCPFKKDMNMNYTIETERSSKYYKEAEKKYDLKQLLTKHGFKDYIIYLKDFIDTLKYLEEKQIPQIVNFSCWIPIDSRELKKNVPGKEKRVTQITGHRRALYLITTEILTRIGIIKTDHSYCPKLFPKSFKFTDKYLPKKCVSTHKNKTKTIQIQKYFNRLLYKKLYTVCPASLRSSELPSTDLKELSEEEETIPTLEEALKICQSHRLKPQTLSEYVESHPIDLPKPVDQTRLESSVVVPDIVKEDFGIVYDKDFSNEYELQKTIFDLKSQAKMIIGIDNKGFSHNTRKMCDTFEIDYGEVLSDHYQWTTRSLRPLKEHGRKYYTFCWRKRDKVFADKVDRVIIFKDRQTKKLNKRTLYLMQELDRQ